MLWTDIIDPATLSGYARASLEDYEANQGTLARWLPNRDVADIVVRVLQGSNGLVDVARFRAYDAEPEIGRRPSARRLTLELPALGLNIPVSEYEQLRMRSGDLPDEAALASFQTATTRVVRAIADAMERLRGIVLATGRATVDQENFKIDDNFGRSSAHQLVAGTLWTTPSVSRLDYLAQVVEQYQDTNGETPGCFVMPNRVFRAFGDGDEFQTQLLNGGARRPSLADVNAAVAAAGLPPIETFDRRVSVRNPVTGASVSTRVLRDDTLLALPAPVDPDDWQATELGATFWGRTLTSTDSEWDIPDSDQPGIVAGVWKNDKPPMGVEIISDAIGMPVLANADLSLAAKVL